MPALRGRGGHGQREPGRAPRLALGVGQLPPGELGTVADLRHRLARRHLQLRVEPEHRALGVGGGGRLGVVQVGAGHLELGQLLGPAVEGDRRVHPYLRAPARHRDPGQLGRLAPLRAARPAHHLADPGVLPVPHRPGPLALAGGPLVGQDREHRAGGGAQGIGPGGRGRLLQVHHEGEHVLRGRVPVGGAVVEGARGDGGLGEGLWEVSSLLTVPVCQAAGVTSLA